MSPAAYRLLSIHAHATSAARSGPLADAAPPAAAQVLHPRPLAGGAVAGRGCAGGEVTGALAGGRGARRSSSAISAAADALGRVRSQWGADTDSEPSADRVA